MPLERILLLTFFASHSPGKLPTLFTNFWDNIPICAQTMDAFVDFYNYFLHYRQIQSSARKMFIFQTIPFFLALICLAEASRRLSQMEGQKPSLQNEVEENVVSQSENDGGQMEGQKSPPHNEDEENVVSQPEKNGGDGSCKAGWENFKEKVCFYGLKAKLNFFQGMDQCTKLGATFTSIHSMDEFEFITSHWDLHHYWIGIVYGNAQFEDGTDVDPAVFDQFKKYVPWAFPEIRKGFICRAKPGQDVKTSEGVISSGSHEEEDGGNNNSVEEEGISHEVEEENDDAIGGYHPEEFDNEEEEEEGQIGKEVEGEVPSEGHSDEKEASVGGGEGEGKIRVEDYSK